jgi:predicted GNAT family acetyltransferase
MDLLSTAREGRTPAGIDCIGVVVDNPGESRFDLWVDDHLVGILAYRLDETLQDEAPSMTLLHTVVKEDFGDHGWAAVLVRGALDGLRESGMTMTPVCTYVTRFLGQNTEYLDLIADSPGNADSPQDSSTTTGA